MAITDLVPVFERITKPNFRLITQVVSAERLHPRKFLLFIVSIFTLCLLLKSLISIWSTSDAFTLEELKHQRNLVQDQRDALVTKVNQISSPDRLAAAATKLGMVPAQSITYIDMSKS